MSETEVTALDVQQLRRGLRDVAALSLLPIVWVESEPRRIAESLAAVLFQMLRLELVYILVRDLAHEIPLEVAHTARGPAPTAQAEEVGRALDPWLNSHDPSKTPSSIANPLGSGMIRTFCTPFGIEARGGFLVAGSLQADFPTDVDRLLLGVATNQMTILLDRRRTEHARRESEERFRGTFENAAVGIVHVHASGRFLRVNETFCAFVGYSREELLQRTYQEITHPDDLAASIDATTALFAGGSPNFALEKRFVRKDGSLVWAQVFVSLQRDASGTPAYDIGVISDITERKRLEEELNKANARMELAVRGSNIGIWDYDLPEGDTRHGRGYFVNAWERLGYEGPEYPFDYGTGMGPVHPDDRALVEEAARSYLAGETSKYEVESRVRHKDGSYRWILARGVAVRDANGKPVRFVGSGVDITDLKLAENALRASEQTFRTFLDHATDAFFLQDDRQVVVDVNRQACLSLGYTRDELIGMTPLDFDPDVTPAMVAEFVRRLDAGETVVFESHHRRKDGSVFPIEVRGRSFWEGERRLTVALARDMTEHKQAEKALRESEAQSRRLLAFHEAVTSHMAEGLYTLDTQARLTYLNPAAESLFGWTSAELLGRKLHDVAHYKHPDGTPFPIEQCAGFNVLSQGTPLKDYDDVFIRKDGTWLPVVSSASQLMVEGEVVGLVVVFHDVTERKRAEDALRESEARFRGTFENAAVGIAHADQEGRWLRVNQKYCEIVGYSREELLQRTFQDITHPDDLATNLEVWATLKRGESPSFSLEKRNLRKDGSPVWLEVFTSLQRDAAGEPTYAITIVQDITERKRLEEALRESERRFRTFVDHAVDAFFLYNEQDRILDVNRQACQDLGYTRDELIGMSVLDVNPDMTPAMLEEVGRRLDAGEMIELAGHRRRKDGSVFPVEIRGRSFWEGGRRLTVALARDVTERNRAEDALRVSEARFRGTFENAAVGIAHTNPEGRLLRVNEKFCSVVGYPRGELLEKTWRDITHPDDLAPSVEVSAAALRGESPSLPLEKRYLRKDGSLVWAELFLSLQRDAAGAPGYLIAIVQDISQRKRLEEALRESERRFRTFVDHATDAFFLFDARHVVLDVNRQACRSLGYTRDELVGKTASDVDPDITPADIEEINRKLNAGEPVAFESRHRRKDGTVFPVEVRGQAFWEGDRNFVVALARDVTERTQAEEALRESERRFRTLAEALPHWVWTAEPDGANDYFNSQITEYTGLTVEQLRGWNWRGVIHPEDLPRCLELWARSIATGEPYEAEQRMRRADGAFRWHLARALALHDDSGRITKWLGSCADIDDQKQAQEVLRESERRFRTLAEALPQMVWTADPDGATDYLNTRCTEYTGLTVEQLRGWNWESTIHPDDLPRCLELWTRSVTTGEPRETEYRHRRADGAFRWHLARAVAIRDDSGRITKWFGSNIDIEDQKRAQETLRAAAEAAEAANRAKDEFLANVSHELRTPMNAILGMTELVLDTPLTDDQRQSLRTVKSAADNLLGILNDLLDFSKIEAGKLELDPADFSLRSAVGETLHALAVRAHRKGLELVCHVLPDVPDALVGDASRLRQVLLNLVGNAIKFTDEGEVVVRVEAAGGPAPDDEVGLHFVVSDTGIGIPPEQQERIFRAFEQEDTSTTRRYGGTGLGLTIAARLVALMGGTISVDSRPGRGSIFAFTARFGRQPPGSEPVTARPPAQLRDLRVLVVDDNATNRCILEEWLRSWRMEPAAVGDGLAALNALWRAVNVGRPYALVLLDARMPDTDGLALAAQLREQAELAATRIILLTSGDRPGDLARSRELRVEAHLFKPVQQEELLEAIYRVMSRANGEAAAPRHAPPEGPSPAPAPAAAPLRILVAEDNEFNKQHLERLLARRGHTVRLADNGREALALLGVSEQGPGASPLQAPGPSPQTPPAGPSPLIPAFDLLLLDLQMPELDGLQVVRAIREQERAAGGHLPVIALTARSRNEDRERCLAAGMDDYLAKPVRSAELLAAIERLVSAPALPRPVSLASEGGPGLLNPAVVLAACGGEAEGLRQMREGLRSYLPGRLAEAGEALRTGDAPRLRAAAHKLCGLLSAFSTSAGGVASDLEDQAASGRLEECRPLVEQLEAMARELTEQVDALSIESLQNQAGAAGNRDRTASP